MGTKPKLPPGWEWKGLWAMLGEFGMRDDTHEQTALLAWADWGQRNAPVISSALDLVGALLEVLDDECSCCPEEGHTHEDNCPAFHAHLFYNTHRPPPSEAPK